MFAFSERRLFISRLADRALNTVTKTLGKNLLHRPTQMVTEPRRPLEVRKPFEADLGERLQEQRTLRQSLIPEELRVTNKGTMLELRWKPEEIVTRVPGMATGVAASASVDSVSSSPTTSSLSVKRDGNPMTQAKTVRQRPPTRILAELLRAQSPSTDVIGSNHLVYGKRGLKITEVVPMGQYAVRLQFSDSHSGGIFPYDYLEMMGRTGDGNKFKIMRNYITQLRENRKSRDPPRPIRRMKESACSKK